ncbi:MAG: MerR family transcriptional regulator [Nitrospirota bacterium]|nr:MerR family transcriptional regulator [Nitrospirota bacterium]
MKPAIPDKLFYKIGEVCRIAGVEAYTLRYWETEFSFLQPRKSKTGQRVYAREDVELVLQIRDLLYHEGYTLAGVRKRFGAKRHPLLEDDESEATEGRDASGVLKKVKKELKALADWMDGNNR